MQEIGTDRHAKSGVSLTCLEVRGAELVRQDVDLNQRKSCGLTWRTAVFPEDVVGQYRVDVKHVGLARGSGQRQIRVNVRGCRNIRLWSGLISYN